MASDPWYSTHRNQWLMKYKPDPSGPWVTQPLGKHPVAIRKGQVPKRIPIEILDRSREFAEMEYRAKHGMGPAPQRAKPLGVYLQAYIDGYGDNHAPGSVILLKRYVERFRAFAEANGVKTVQGVNKAICRDYLEARVKDVSVSTAKTEKGVLGGIWSRAVDDELISVNPWSLVKVPGKMVEPIATFWTSEEIGRIAAAIGKPWQSDIVLLMANTGMRITAALWIEWTWIDWAGNAIKIPPAHGFKGGYTHILGSLARSILERLQFQSTSAYVFPNPRNGRPFDQGTLTSAIKVAIRKAGVPDGSPHDLRHSYGRAMERQGVPMSVIQKQMGHRTPSMTFRYTSADASEATKWTGDIRIGEITHHDPPSDDAASSSPPPAIGPSPSSEQ